MNHKGPQLSAHWSRREKDLLFKWDDGCSAFDARLLYEVVDHLEARGYDLTTLRFSVRKHVQEDNDG